MNKQIYKLNGSSMSVLYVWKKSILIIENVNTSMWRKNNVALYHVEWCM